MADILGASNIMSQWGQRNPQNSKEERPKSQHRMSAAEPIQSASEDAAGLGLSSRSRLDGRVHATSIQRMNAGISALHVLSGSLKNQIAILKDMQSVAEQSLQPHRDAPERKSHNTKYAELLSDLQRENTCVPFPDSAIFMDDNNIKLEQVNLDSPPRLQKSNIEPVMTIREFQNGLTNLTAIDYSCLSSEENSKYALEGIKTRLEELIKIQSSFESKHMQLESECRALLVKRLKEVGESRIEDVEIALQAASTIVTEIELDGHTCILAQANQQSKLALQLLSNG